jgi:WhiB family redox-sensing transcriptional regulator
MIFNATFDWDERSWRDQAACRDCAPELFFPIGSTGMAAGEILAAKEVCLVCPVREECLQFAFKTNQESGIWGGTSEEERRRLRKAWLTARRQGVAAR